MFSLGGGEVFVVLVIALLVLGPERLPGAARQLGKWVAQLRTMTSGVQSELRDALQADELRDSVREVMTLRDEVVGIRQQLTSELTGLERSVKQPLRDPLSAAKSSVGGLLGAAPTSSSARSSRSGSSPSEADRPHDFPYPDHPLTEFDLIPPPDGISLEDLAIDHPMDLSRRDIPEPRFFIDDVLGSRSESPMEVDA